MKTLKKGRISEVQKPWWQTCTHSCDGCGAQWMLEDSDGDSIEVITERSPKGESIVTSTCPTCGARVKTRQSHANYLRMGRDLANWRP